MKFVTWNCNGAFRKKLHTLDMIKADLIIVQECEDPAQSSKAFRDWANTGDYLWKGDNKNRGIGVFARNGASLHYLAWEDYGFKSFVPFCVNDKFNMIGVWTKENNSSTFRYIGQFWKYMRQNKEKIAAQPFLICGDFNSNKIWDKKDRHWNHSDVVMELEEIGIFSLYHRLYNQIQGKESQPTLYLHRKLEKPYHVDYVFASQELCDRAELRIGDHNQWLEFSDHMPIIFKLDIH
ncbi:MAG: endonuclease/exonuclease/phosphatase family protein [Nitrospinota bacterium]|nr:endonuclease/exonuclease/phosphatase family protein [Nitrospinota bacterium]